MTDLADYYQAVGFFHASGLTEAEAYQLAEEAMTPDEKEDCMDREDTFLNAIEKEIKKENGAFTPRQLRILLKMYREVLKILTKDADTVEAESVEPVGETQNTLREAMAKEKEMGTPNPFTASQWRILYAMYKELNSERGTLDKELRSLMEQLPAAMEKHFCSLGTEHKGLTNEELFDGITKAMSETKMRALVEIAVKTNKNAELFAAKIHALRACLLEGGVLTEDQLNDFDEQAQDSVTIRQMEKENRRFVDDLRRQLNDEEGRTL